MDNYTRYVQSMIAESQQKTIDELLEALKDIATSDDIDNALDPERNKRVARAALSRARGDIQKED